VSDREDLRDRIVMNDRNYKMTGTMRAVLAAVVDAPEAEPAWGLSVCNRTGLGPGAVYPALDKLMQAGLICDQWETPAPADRPRRRFYHGSFGRSWYRANRLLGAETDRS
jgi:PadR family transcriptional regulator, regulatory protein PadR